MDIKKRKLSEELSDHEDFSTNYNSNYASANKSTNKSKHFKSENLTDSETDHDSPVKKFQNFFDNNKPQATFKSDFELAFEQNDSMSKNMSRGAFYSPNRNSTHNNIGYKVSNEIQRTNDSISANKQTDDSENNRKSVKRTHDDPSSMNGIGYKLMVFF
jgi:hypothetical protein